MNSRELITAKHTARLAKLPANSGHAKVLRGKLGITDAPPAAPAPVVEKVKAPAPKAKAKTFKKKTPKTD